MWKYPGRTTEPFGGGAALLVPGPEPLVVHGRRRDLVRTLAEPGVPRVIETRRRSGHGS
jgi:hypothetical protein